MSSPAAGTMDAIYRHQRFVYDATRRYYLFGRDEMLARLDPARGSSVLEVGCGTARNLIHAARLYPDAEFYGFDVSEEMLKTARRSIVGSGLSGKILLAHGDATRFCTRQLFRLYAVDRIFISYALSMIPNWTGVIDQAMQALAPRGELHVVDFGNMKGLPRGARQAMLAWLAHFEVTPREDLNEAIHSTAARHGLSSSFKQGRFGYAAHAVIKSR